MTKDAIHHVKELAALSTELAAEIEQLAAERDATVAALRDLCHELGDNDWPETLPLAEVIQQHLAAHIFNDE